MARFYLTAFLMIILSVFLLPGCSSTNCSTSFGAAAGEVVHPVSRVSVDVIYSDHVPITGVEIFCDNPLVHIFNAVTDDAGNYVFGIQAPNGSSFTLTFHKDGHIIHSVSFTIGEGGIVMEDGSILYPLVAVGYIPFGADGAEGRVSDFIEENVALFNAPVDAVVSPDGKKVYISEEINNRIRVFDVASEQLSTLAGSAISGYRNGIGADARFNQPAGMAITSNGKYLYVCESENHCIRKIDTQTAEVSLFTGTPEVSGNAPGGPNVARFYIPFEIAFSHDESLLYVADAWNKSVRKIDVATGNVTTLGTAFTNNIYGVTVAYDPDTSVETVYVSATFQYRIYSMNVSTGAKTLIAGSSAGFADGPGASAKFGLPTGIVASHDAKFLYLCDYLNSKIRKIDLDDNSVSTLSGAGEGYANGPGSQAKFLYPYSLGISNDDKTLYVPDYQNQRLRTVDTASGYTGKISGGGRAGFHDGPDGESLISFYGNVFDVLLSDDKNILYASDFRYIWKINLETREVSTVASSCYIGSALAYNTSYGSENHAVAHKMVFSHDRKIIYIADSSSNMIRSVELATGNSTIIAGNTVAGFNDAVSGADVRFSQPNGLVLSPSGNELFVTDGKNSRVRKVVVSSGETVTVAGSSAGFAEGTGTAARFNLPSDIVISPDGKFFYVADSYNHRIRKIDTVTYEVTTFAGSDSVGRQDGVGLAAVFDEPRGLAMSADGSVLLVCDYRGSNIRQIRMSDISVTSLAGGIHYGFADGSGAQAILSSPDGISISDDLSIVYFADSLNAMVRRIVSSYVTTY